MPDGWGYANTNDSVHYRHRSGWPGWCGRSFGVATTNIWGRRSHWIVSRRKGGTLILTRQTIVSTRPGREVRSYERDGRMYLDGGSYQRGLDGCSYRWTCVSTVKQCTHAHVDEEGKYAHMKGTDVCIDEEGIEARINEETTEALSTRNSRTLISTISTRNGFDEEWSVEEGTHAQSHLYDKEGRYAVRLYLVWKRFTLVSRQGFTIHVVHWLIMSRKLK